MFAQLGAILAAIRSAVKTIFGIRCRTLAGMAVTAAAGPFTASLVGDWFHSSERGRIYGYIISGDYTQLSTGRLILDADGNNDVLRVGGLATLGGTFELHPVNGYVPYPWDSFALVNYGGVAGTFDAYDLPPPYQGSWVASYDEHWFSLYVQGGEE